MLRTIPLAFQNYLVCNVQKIVPEEKFKKGEEKGGWEEGGKKERRKGGEQRGKE